VYYLDECVLSLSDMPRQEGREEPAELREMLEGEVTMTVLASAHGIIKYEVRFRGMG
jgi:hypothetical protein